MSIREKAIVKMWEFDRGFGFLKPEKGDDIFAHVSALPKNVPSLEVGEAVVFTRTMGRKGDQAVAIELEKPTAAPAPREIPIVDRTDKNSATG
jgi:CspA family cold shock protein